MSDVHIRYSAVVCAIPLGFSLEPEVYNMNKKSFLEEVGPYCDFFVGPHVVHRCCCNLSVGAAEDSTRGEEGEICNGGVDDALQCHHLLPFQTLVGGHD